MVFWLCLLVVFLFWFFFLKKWNDAFKLREISVEGLDTRLLHATLFRGNPGCAFKTHLIQPINAFLVVAKLKKSLC